MPLIVFKKGTKEQLDNIATANKLIPNEPYFLIDLNAIAIGITKSEYVIIGGILNDILPVEKGGTSADNKTDALINLLPTISGNEGKVLRTNGTSIYWSTFEDFSLTKNIIKNEIPIGELNGINRVFTLRKQPIPNTLTVYRNGIKQKMINNNYIFDSNDQYKYDEENNQIILTNTIDPPNYNNKDWLEVDYHTLNI